MKTVLIVDDEKLFLASLTEGLASQGNEFLVVTANNGKQAIDIINSRTIDLIVTDLKMPVMDGFQLLVHLMNENMNLPVIVMTAFGTPEIENQIGDFHAFGYLEKPIDFQKLADKISDGLSQTKGAKLSGVSLFSFLQLLQGELKTCSLKVRAKGREGALLFYKGELFDAVSGTVKGEAAALQIVCWEDAEIEIVNIFKKIKQRIHKRLPDILAEAAQIMHESALTSEPKKPVLLSENRQHSPFDDLASSKTVSQPAKRLDPKAEKQDSSVERPENKPKQNKSRNIEEIHKNMANNIAESLEDLMTIDGAKAVALVDSTSGMVLGTAGGGMDMDIAAAGNSDVVKAKKDTMNNLGIKDSIEDILITLTDQYHLIRPLKEHGNLFFYLVLGKAKANLAMARFKLADVESKVKV